MKTKLLSLLVALIATSALWASNTITYTATDKLINLSLYVGATTFGPAITSHTFSNGTGTITCSSEITTLGEGAFSYSSLLTSITIPNSVTMIGEDAFSGCNSLTSITIPNSVTMIGDGAFNGCSGLTSPVYNTHCFAFMPTSYTGAYTIPDGITQIVGGAFSKCKNLTSITIPNSVTTIGERAFYGCRGLTSITIPHSVTTIGYYAFADCSGLTSINVDATNTHYASVNGVLFTYVKDTLIQYPNGNIRTSYTIPNSVTTIGECAFYNCLNLTSITIPNSVTTIGGEAFYECSGLTSITIPNSVTTIGGSAFYDCSGLTSITIPNSVTTIGYYAFSDCSGLTSITCNAIIPPTCEDDCFDGVDHSIPLYVPVNSVSAYQTANEWKEFTNILPIEETDLETMHGSQCTMHNVKLIKNGHLLIERNGIRYNAHGARVK